MTSDYLHKKLAGMLLALSLLIGIGMTSSVTTQAQWTQWPNSSRSRDYEREQRRRQRELEREQRRQQRVYTQNNGRYSDNYGYGRNNGGSFELRQTALNAGYNEGIKEGRRDRQRGGYSDFGNKSSYRNATTDYSSKLGDRELYRQYYRQGFQNGYRDGMNGYRN